jgi:hypothetical protein
MSAGSSVLAVIGVVCAWGLGGLLISDDGWLSAQRLWFGLGRAPVLAFALTGLGAALLAHTGPVATMVVGALGAALALAVVYRARTFSDKRRATERTADMQRILADSRAGAQLLEWSVVDGDGGPRLDVRVRTVTGGRLVLTSVEGYRTPGQGRQVTAAVDAACADVAPGGEAWLRLPLRTSGVWRPTAWRLRIGVSGSHVTRLDTQTESPGADRQMGRAELPLPSPTQDLPGLLSDPALLLGDWTGPSTVHISASRWEEGGRRRWWSLTQHGLDVHSGDGLPVLRYQLVRLDREELVLQVEGHEPVRWRRLR